LGIGRQLQRLRDRLDEEHARRQRRRLGRKRWIVSWARVETPEPSWRARLSCPELPLTVERRGPSRGAAIGRAVEALTQMLSAS
jgi:hypothetical protein